jgi:membrane protease YdiL (CAAX protease family)
MQTRRAPRESLKTRLTRLEPPPPWGGGTVAGMIATAALLLIVGTFVTLTWLPPTAEARLAGWALGGLLLIGLIALQNRNRPHIVAALRLGPGSTPLPFVLFLAVGVALTLDLLSLALTGGQFLPAPELAGVNPQGSLLAWALALGFMLVIQPISEELVFRGFAFPWLRVKAGAWGGLLASAALYALFHVLIYPPDYSLSNPTADASAALWYGLALPFFAGLTIAATRAVTGSTRAAIIAHAGFGLFAILKLLALAG